MDLTSIVEKVSYLNSKEDELREALKEVSLFLEYPTPFSNTSGVQHMHLQELLNRVADIRRIIGGFNVKVPDIQEDIRNMLQELEDKLSLEE